MSCCSSLDSCWTNMWSDRVTAFFKRCQQLHFQLLCSCIFCMINHNLFPELWGRTVKINMKHQRVLDTYYQVENSHLRIWHLLIHTIFIPIINPVNFTLKYISYIHPLLFMGTAMFLVQVSLITTYPVHYKSQLTNFSQPLKMYIYS